MSERQRRMNIGHKTKVQTDTRLFCKIFVTRKLLFMKKYNTIAIISFIAVVCLLPMLHHNTEAAGDESLYPLFLKPARHSSWQYGGHLETGLYVNQYGQKNMYTGDTIWPGGPDEYSGNTYLLQNVMQSDWQMNQAWFYFGKELDTRCGWDFGGRIDYVYGTDARYLQSYGLETEAGHGYWGTGDYYSALGQAYLEAGYGKLSVKFGKFFSPLGHESLNATERFFYSLSKSFGATPDTNTGALFTLELNKKLSVYSGWTQGPNQFFDTGRDNSFTGGFNYHLGKHTHLGYGLQVGSNTRDDIDYFYQSLYLTHHLNDHWQYAFEWSLGNETDEGDHLGVYGIDQALYYHINQNWAIGVRLEWEHEYDTGNSADIYAVTLGANWKPRHWLLIRPEIRYDKAHGGYKPFNQTKSNAFDPRSEQMSGGFSAVVKF